MPGKKYSESQEKLLALLRGKEKTILMAAPSFVVDFDYMEFVPRMKGLGFDLVSELTFGAKMVNVNYREYIGKNKSRGRKGKKFIASVCPMIVSIVKGQSPELKSSLLPFDSPMVAMAKILRRSHPSCKIAFMAPCSAKKAEAKKSGIIDAVVTFKEMKELVDSEKPGKKGKSHLFDRFYNDYTKIYPLSGGLSATLHSKGILSPSESVACDNCKNIQSVFEKEPGKVFYDLLFCPGGCIGGPGIASNKSIEKKKRKVMEYREFARGEKIGDRRGLEKYTKGLSFRRNY